MTCALTFLREKRGRDERKIQKERNNEMGRREGDEREREVKERKKLLTLWSTLVDMNHNPKCHSCMMGHEK